MPRPSTESEAVHAFPAESDTAVVAFAPRGRGRGPFAYHRLVDQLPPCSKLIVQDPADAWYNAGLPGIGATVEEIAAWIKVRLAGFGASRVVTFGGSMGGYAAILFGCLIGATRAVAFSPQTILDSRLPYAPPPGLPLQVIDVEPVVRATPATRIDVVFGWNVLADVFHAERLADLPSVRIVALESDSHVAMADLHRQDRLVPLLREALAGREPEPGAIAPTLTHETRLRIEAAVYASQREDWPNLASQIEPVVERHPAWCGPRYQLGRALTAMGDLDRAAANLRSVVETNPNWRGPCRAYAELLIRRGDAEEAERVIREGLSFSPEWLGGQLTLIDCLNRLGRHTEAQATADRMERHVRARLEEIPHWKAGRAALEEIQLRQRRDDGKQTATTADG